MQEQRLANFVAQNIDRKLPIERSPIEQVRDQVVAVWLELCLGILLEALLHAIVHVPVRPIDCDIADAVAAFFEHLTKAIAFLCRVSFLKKRIAKQRSPVAIGRDDRLVAYEIRNEIVVACFAQIHQMRIRMVTDQMAGIVPCA